MIVHVQNDVLALCGEGRREEDGEGERGERRGRKEGEKGKEGGREGERVGGESRREEVGSEVKVYQT